MVTIDTQVGERTRTAAASGARDRDTTGARPDGRSGARIDAAFLYVPFLAGLVLTFATAPDDAFITLRYAWNLLHGHGLVFNVGERVNGATSPAGVVLALAALSLPGGATLLKLKLLDVAIVTAGLWLGRDLVVTMALPRGVRRLALVLLGVSPMVVFSASSGLETAVAIVATTGMMVELTRGWPLRPWRAPLYGVLAVLARPEAVGVVAGLVVASLVVARPRAVADRIRWAGPAVVVEALLLLGNRVYYGDWVPNTALAKAGPHVAAFRQSVVYLLHTADSQFSVPGVPVPVIHAVVLGAVLVLAAGVVAAVAAWRRYLPVLAAVGAQAVFVLWSGSDWMRGFRFMAPVVAGVVVLDVLGAAAIGAAVARAVGARGAEAPDATAGSGGAAGPHSGVAQQITLLVLCVMVVVAAGGYTVAGQDFGIWKLDRGVSDQTFVDAGSYLPAERVWALMPRLLACARPGDLVATTESGYGPYVRPDLRVLDLRGLADRTIAARAPTALKSDTGVTDPTWFRPTSMVGTVILATDPVLIESIDVSLAPPATVLAGRYHRVATVRVAGIAGPVGEVYARMGSSCDHPPDLSGPVPG